MPWSEEDGKLYRARIVDFKGPTDKQSYCDIKLHYLADEEEYWETNLTEHEVRLIRADRSQELEWRHANVEDDDGTDLEEDSEDEDFDPKDEPPPSPLNKHAPAPKTNSPAKLNASAAKRKTSAAKAKSSSNAKTAGANLQELIGKKLSILWANKNTYEGEIVDFRVLGSSASSDVMIKIFYEGMCFFVALCTLALPTSPSAL